MGAIIPALPESASPSRLFLPRLISKFSRHASSSSRMAPKRSRRTMHRGRQRPSTSCARWKYTLTSPPSTWSSSRAAACSAAKLGWGRAKWSSRTSPPASPAWTTPLPTFRRRRCNCRCKAEQARRCRGRSRCRSCACGPPTRPTPSRPSSAPGTSATRPLRRSWARGCAQTRWPRPPSSSSAPRSASTTSGRSTKTTRTTGRGPSRRGSGRRTRCCRWSRSGRCGWAYGCAST
mmetsp:Transcript_35402/g.83320  ORF Transcript_35402/g.83320 Transcript_35402/m.83320 type:complete len:234 (-) Transcript_35402:1353-2054(-)